MPSAEHINQEREILEVWRQTLVSYRRRLAQLGSAHAPPEITHGLAEARQAVQKSKTNLRLMGVDVEDIPGDEGTDLQASDLQIETEHVPSYERNNPIRLFVETPITLGSQKRGVFEYIYLPEYENISVECDIRILDDGDDDQQWAGFRLRGFRLEVDHIGLGYLTYIRSMGTVELYRKTRVIAGDKQKVVDSAKQAWVHIRTDIYTNILSIWVNGQLHVTKKDKSFGEAGFLCLHTHRVVAQFRNIQAFEII